MSEPSAIFTPASTALRNHGRDADEREPAGRQRGSERRQTSAYPPAHQPVASAAYWSAASSQTKWPPSSTSSLLLGSRSCKEHGVGGRNQVVTSAGDD